MSQARYQSRSPPGPMLRLNAGNGRRRGHHIKTRADCPLRGSIRWTKYPSRSPEPALAPTVGSSTAGLQRTIQAGAEMKSP